MGWTASDHGGWAGDVGGSRSVVSFDVSGGGLSRRGDSGDEATVEAAAPAPIARSLDSISTSASESRSIFGLSRRYIELALCSSGRTVIPVRLGRAIVEPTVPLKTPSPTNQNGSLTRPARPPRTVTGNPDARIASRSHASSAGVATIPQVGRRSSFVPACPADGAAVNGGGGGAPHACVGWDGSSSELPINNDRQQLDNEPTRGSGLRSSLSPNGAGTVVPGTSAELNNSNSQGAENAGVSCSRTRRCGASPARERSASSERLGGGEEIGALLAKYNRNEAYDCPVSPFSLPPSWAEIPPLATVEPPGFPPSCTTPGDATVEEARVQTERAGHLGGRESGMSLQVEGGTRKISVVCPAEKTLFQKIASGRRTSFGWGWKRPSGDRGPRPKRTGMSPRERGLSSGTNLSGAYPPNS